ncbi:LOW QUALITY PROTEIN: hypothetical protein CVT25_001455, partial [Psilocybe cyanescens]
PLIAAVILYYDYILTFSDEYNLYWSSETRFSFATALFYLNRYVTILAHIPTLVLGFGSWYHTDRLKLRTIQVYVQSVYSNGPTLIRNSGISIFRTYALYGHNRHVALLLCTLVIAVIVYVMSSFVTKSVAIALYVEDHHTSPTCQSLCGVRSTVEWMSSSCVDGFVRLAKAYIGLLVFETMVFGLTLYRSLTSECWGFTIMYILIRDGKIVDTSE